MLCREELTCSADLPNVSIPRCLTLLPIVVTVSAASIFELAGDYVTPCCANYPPRRHPRGDGALPAIPRTCFSTMRSAALCTAACHDRIQDRSASESQ